MNNTDKLLRAFIEASGYEVEEVTTECTTDEANVFLLDKNYKTDYKVTKRIAMGVDMRKEFPDENI